VIPADWIEHHRADGERVGWLVPSGDGFLVVDLLGRIRTEEAVDWLSGEQVLDGLGIGYLADRYRLLVDGSEREVRLSEVSADGITAVADDFGSASAVHPGHVRETFRLPFPAPATLRPA
jgi:hypothetical protein